MDLSVPLSTLVVTCLQVLFLTRFSQPLLLDDPVVPCPNPATNCLDDMFNRVLSNLGCLGCQSGCQDGYIMTANPGYFVTEGDTTGTYDYQNITVPKSKNVSEPQWLCLAGDTCPWGYFTSEMGGTDSCAYCGAGCRSCQDYENCDFCLLGYRPTIRMLPDNTQVTGCESSGVLCPHPPDNCQHEAYASEVVGCSGCIICDDGYLPTYNPSYRRAPENVSGNYQYQGLSISGSVEIDQPRYLCILGDSCAPGFHNVTRAGATTCEADSASSTLVVG